MSELSKKSPEAKLRVVLSVLRGEVRIIGVKLYPSASYC